MPDKKLTDLEVVKALECCVNTTFISDCAKCKMLAIDCKDKLIESALDLINRLQAENERLKAKVNHYNYCYDNFVNTPISRIKAEAYKEVEEKLDRTTWYRINQKGELVVGANSETDIPLFKAEDVFNLLKEMVGEDNAKEKE